MDRYVMLAIDEYLRWLYVQPVLTAVFTCGFVVVLSLSLIDIAFGLARRLVK
jgi:hypothetical protein